VFYTGHELQNDELVHRDYKQFCCSSCSKHCVVQHCRYAMIRDLTTCNLYTFVVVVPLKHVYECVTQLSVAPCNGHYQRNVWQSDICFGKLKLSWFQSQNCSYGLIVFSFIHENLYKAVLMTLLYAVHCVDRRLAAGEPNVCKCVWRHRNVCSSSATYYLTNPNPIPEP